MVLTKPEQLTRINSTPYQVQGQTSWTRSRLETKYIVMRNDAKRLGALRGILVVNSPRIKA